MIRLIVLLLLAVTQQMVPTPPTDLVTGYVTRPPPFTISGISPTSGSAGTATTITGNGFAAGLTAALVCPSGSTNSANNFPMGSVSVTSATSATATVPTLPSSIALPVTCDVVITLPASAWNGDKPLTARLKL
jgi:hypothetical protein